MPALDLFRRLQLWTLDRRRHPREFADGSVLVKTPDGTIMTAELVDRSPGGLRIRFSGDAFPAGARLLVMAPFSDFDARVAWSRPTQTGAGSGPADLAGGKARSTH